MRPPPTGGLTGLVYLDDNENSAQDVGESPYLTPIEMVITDADSVVHTVMTSAVTGDWSVANLPLGNATVDANAASIPAGFEASAENYPVTIAVVADVETTVEPYGVKVVPAP